VTLSAADLVVTQTPLEGWGVASAGGETVALDLAVSDALRFEGYAREAVRLIQEARKASGLDVSDRIVVRWTTADAGLAAALQEHGAMIAGEVLAVSFGQGDGPAGDGPGGDGPGGDGPGGDGPGGGAGADAGGGGAAGPWHEYADTDLGLRFWLALAAA
jgi:isoleucyl-tRNA synthetase